MEAPINKIVSGSSRLGSFVTTYVVLRSVVGSEHCDVIAPATRIPWAWALLWYGVYSAVELYA